MTPQQYLATLGVNLNRPLTKIEQERLLVINSAPSKVQQGGGQVVVRDQNNNAIETITAPGQVKVFVFGGIRDRAISGNTEVILDNPF